MIPCLLMVQTCRQDYGTPRYALVLGEAYLEETVNEALEEQLHAPPFVIHLSNLGV